MKIPVEKELAMKKAILHAIENGYGAAKLASGFGVSKSTIYKYRRALRDQGYIEKINDVYVIAKRNFCAKSERPNTDLEAIKSSNIQIDVQSSNIQELTASVEDKIQQKLEEIRHAQEEQPEQDQGIIKKFFGKFMKKS